MKRLAWLWGALLGLLLLPLLTLASGQAALRLLPTPSGVKLPPFDLFDFLQVLPYYTNPYGFWGAGLGLCGALLWTGDHSLRWRLLGLLVGTGATFYYSWRLWTNWNALSSLHIPAYTNFFRWSHTATASPSLLAGLALVFFALLLRPRPQLREQR